MSTEDRNTGEDNHADSPSQSSRALQTFVKVIRSILDANEDGVVKTGTLKSTKDGTTTTKSVVRLKVDSVVSKCEEEGLKLFYTQKEKEDGTFEFYVSTHTLNKYRKLAAKGVAQVLKEVSRPLYPEGVEKLVSDLDKIRFSKKIATKKEADTVFNIPIDSEGGRVGFLEGLMKSL